MDTEIITPFHMVNDLNKKIEWFEKNPPRDRETGIVMLDPRFTAQVNMLKAMRDYIAGTISSPPESSNR